MATVSNEKRPLVDSHSTTVRNDDMKNLPTNVDSLEKLKEVPEGFLSGNWSKPLQHADEYGEVRTYALQPMFYSVVYILLMESLQMFAFYGLNFTAAAFLTGVYEPSWNARFTAIEASSYVSISTAVAFTSPFLGAYFADVLMGDFWTITVGVACLFGPGVLLIALTTIPGFLGKTFNVTALNLGFLVLWPLGAGLIKSVVNVFGAKQYHPLLQPDLIRAYYINFYMCINIGALLGCIIVPVVAEHSLVAAYFIPVVVMVIATVAFVSGYARYNKTKPQRVLFGVSSRQGNKELSGLKVNVVEMLGLTLLILPFNIAYSQMATTFIVQGTVMEMAFGFIDASTLSNADCLSVLLFGYLVGSHLYPRLAKHGVKLPTTNKFAIGSFLGGLSVLWAALVDILLIRPSYLSTGQKVSILWQAPSYALIGAGEIFTISASFEVAFMTAPPEKKSLASAINLFAIGGLPSVLCVFLYRWCATWFYNNAGNSQISTLALYAQAHVYKYYLLLCGISLLGVSLNCLPTVKRWVERIEERAATVIKTPGPHT